MQSISTFVDLDHHSVTFSLPVNFVEENLDQLNQAVEPYMADCQRFIIDLSQTDKIDNVVLGNLLILKERIEAQAGVVVLLNPQGLVLSMLERANFAQLFCIEFSQLAYDI